MRAEKLHFQSLAVRPDLLTELRFLEEFLTKALVH